MTYINIAADDSAPRPNDIGSALVDRIGLLKAQIAPTLELLKALEKDLKQYGPGRVQGEFYEATISVAERDTLDMKAVREKLTRQFIVANTKTTEVTTLKVTARVLP